MNEKVLTKKEFAQELGLSEWSIWRWTKEGKMSHIRIDKRIFYRLETIRKWLTDVEETSVVRNKETQFGIRQVKR